MTNAARVPQPEPREPVTGTGPRPGVGDRPRIPTYQISYQGSDISEAISDRVERIQVVEELEGQADSLTLMLNNVDRVWHNEWTPMLGDLVTVSIGYVGGDFTEPCSYEVDEPTYKFAADTCELKGQATPITKAVRQRNSAGYEGYNLADLAAEVAARHGLELVGNVPPITFERTTQKNEFDLGWLKKLGLRYGVIFKVHSCTQLVFYYEPELEAAPPAFVVLRTLLDPGGASSLKKSAADTYKSCVVRYKDPKTDELYDVEVETNNPDVRSGSTLTITGERFENIGQATKRAEEALRKANSGLVTGTLDLEGEVFFRAGLNIELLTDPLEFGTLGGKYQIRKVTHTVVPTRGVKMGWRSALEVRKIYE